jgi:hypothetical protein
MLYVMTLRVAGSGWTSDRRADYFRWFDRAAALRGGVSFEEYLRDIRREAVARLTPAERTALGGLLTEKPRTDPYAGLKARPVVKEWKYPSGERHVDVTGCDAAPTPESAPCPASRPATRRRNSSGVAPRPGSPHPA